MSRLKASFKDAERRLDLFFKLPLECRRDIQLDALMKFIIERIVHVIPGAKRGASLVKGRTTGDLALMAHVPTADSAVSLTLISQAMAQHYVFIWPPLVSPTVAP